MTRLTAIAALCSSIAFLVAAGFVWRATPVSADHHRYAAALIRAEDLDVRLDAELARSRLGLVTHYDGLVRLHDEIAANVSVLRRVPRHAGLTAELANYESALSTKDDVVEDFKTQQAIVRNSVRLLPFMSDRVVRSEPADSPVHRAALALVAAVLAGSVDPSPGRWAAAQCALVPLGGAPRSHCKTMPLPIPPDQATAAAALVRHGTVVIERQPAVDATLRQLSEIEVGATARDLRLKYQIAYETALNHQSRWLSVAGGLAVSSILFSALAIITRQLATTAALRQATAELELANAALEIERDREVALSELKNRFVAMTSHEFRTPLSVIMSSTDLLQAYGETWELERREKHLSRVLSSGRSMLRMLDRILVIGRADSGLLELKPGRVVVGDLLESVITEVRTFVGNDRGLEVVDETRNCPLLLDERLMHHVLGNLLSNAFKYSPDDSVVRVNASTQAGHLVLSVADDGIGIPDTEHKRLFEPFHRCTNALDFAGTGLGLPVVKRSVDVQGGSVEVHSTMGVGTRIVVRIPVEFA